MPESLTTPSLFRSTGNVPPSPQEEAAYQRAWANKYCREAQAARSEAIDLVYRNHYQTAYILALEWYMEVFKAHNYAQNSDAKLENAIQLGMASEAVDKARTKLELCGEIKCPN